MIKVPSLMGAVLSLFMLTSCDSQESKLQQRLLNYFENDILEHTLVWNDLNFDGHSEAIIFATGSSWCGNAGCTLFIFHKLNDEYQLFSRTTITRPPILASNNANQFGWKNLIVNVKGHGDAVLEGSDDGYPLNPSMQPLATPDEISNAEVLISLLVNRPLKALR